MKHNQQLKKKKKVFCLLRISAKATLPPVNYFRLSSFLDLFCKIFGEKVFSFEKKMKFFCSKSFEKNLKFSLLTAVNPFKNKIGKNNNNWKMYKIYEKNTKKPRERHQMGLFLRGGGGESKHSGEEFSLRQGEREYQNFLAFFFGVCSGSFWWRIFQIW